MLKLSFTKQFVKVHCYIYIYIYIYIYTFLFYFNNNLANISYNIKSCQDRISNIQLTDTFENICNYLISQDMDLVYRFDCKIIYTF